MERNGTRAPTLKWNPLKWVSHIHFIRNLRYLFTHTLTQTLSSCLKCRSIDFPGERINLKAKSFFMQEIRKFSPL